MNGINAHTGQALSGIDHLRQSIRDILTTRIGTRVMRRDYGSRLPTLVDNPMTQGWPWICTRPPPRPWRAGSRVSS